MFIERLAPYTCLRSLSISFGIVFSQMGEKKRKGLYARAEPMRANVLPDAQTMPELAALLEGSVVPYLGALRDLLAEGWEVGDDSSKRLLATLKLAIDFHTWRTLERGSGLNREEAVETMLEAARSCVSRPETP